MMVLKCKMCGGQLSFEEGSTVCECEYCGSKQTIPTADNEKKITLYERANRLRINSEFDKAAGVYENIVAEFSEDAEAYWGLVLCRYGIEYVDDPATGKKIPTCHRSSFDSVMDDSDFEMVMENSDTLARGVYREQAKQIEEIRKGIVEISGKEDPYDIFICYKETAEDGQRTIDSVLAQDVYDALTAKGYRVFFSRISLEDKLGVEYEPYIFAALNSAKIMLAFGTSYDYYNAVWVKNEWSRYLKLMAKDKEKHLIPCFKDIDAYDIPKEFAKLQAQDLGKIGATQDLLRGIEKLIGVRETVAASTQAQAVVVQQSGGPNVNALLQRGYNALEDEDWDAAKDFFNRVLDFNANCAEGYLGLFMADISAADKNHVKNIFKESKPGIFNENKNFLRAKKNAEELLASEIASWEQVSIEEENKQFLKESERLAALEKSKKDAIDKKNAAREAIKELKKEYESIDNADVIPSDEEKTTIDCLKKAVADAQREYDSAIQNYENNPLQKEKESLKQKIAERAAYLSTLGIFKGSEKASVRNQIETLEKEYINLLNQVREIEKTISEKESVLETAKSQLADAFNEIRLSRKKTLEEKIGELAICGSEVGDIVTFGQYYHGSGKKPIEWIVIASEINRRLLISKYAIESYKYSRRVKNIIWADCELRAFLNNEFYNKAFSASEQDRIVSAELSNKHNYYYDESMKKRVKDYKGVEIDGGSDTTDKIFCLSVDEATKYFPDDEARACEPTDYVKSKGVGINEVKIGFCSWWLRSPSTGYNHASVFCTGGIQYIGDINNGDKAVRPALWINVE